MHIKCWFHNETFFPYLKDQHILKDLGGIWTVPDFVWHGLNGQIMKKEPIKPKKSFNTFLSKTKKSFFHDTLNLSIELNLQKQAGLYFYKRKNLSFKSVRLKIYQLGYRNLI